VLLVVAVLVAGGVALALVGRSVTQPIAFNHRLHVDEVGAECIDCHRYALEGARATIPNLDVCAECHEESQTDSIEEARVVEHIQEGVPILWRKIYRVPDHVYFSHRRHTAIAGIACETCHGEVATQELPLTRPLIHPTMDHCMECHEEAGASNDCVYCHR
jgi:hypothetical protein